MSLTGLPLLITGVVVTLVLAAGTGLLWWRTARVTRRPWLVRGLVRTLALLLTEVVAVLTVAIGVNRALEIYPSWSVFFGGVRDVEKVTTAPSADLETWLHGHAPEGRNLGFSFTWKPAEESAWKLAAPPVVAVPAAYFRDQTARFPVIVVAAPPRTDPPAGGWDDRHALQAARGADAAVVVFVRLADPAAALPVLTEQLPDRLGRDLRVQPDNWAVAGVGPAQALALDMVAGSRDRYLTAALVSDGSHAPAADLLDRARRLPAGLNLVVVAGEPAGKGLTSDTVAHPTARLTAALRWVQQRLPAPLAEPLINPTAPVAGGPHG
ncbi:hypothetical protein HC031_31420 [Planosporangium thailandense]|uniref:Uncharacterized protein n=1 Tax=Planosporangium thailandense TaxID=765197 RepID=A0ABX0Y6Y4_9ACTN|nr:hypothetical protein [Planosporangium thailandense]NJC74191.1 hypothetical protein [Planosporangium thailandense]